MRPAKGFSILATLFLLVTLVVALTPAWGQEVTAAITGTVVDPTGAPIPNASVTATDTQRGVTWPTRTNEVGAYFLPRVPTGTYKLKVEAKGFQTAVYPDFTLVMNQTARIDINMKVGQVSETLEVSSTAPLLQTDTTQLSTLIDDKTTVAMPLASRNYIQLILLTPGAVHPNPQSITVANTMTGAGRPYINGNREQANNFILDGMDNNQVGDNEVGYTPSVDAIQEFNLISQNPSAEFGDFQGGIVNTTIKSGTNKLHGSLFEFFRNDVLNANQWANGLVVPTLEKPKLRWNMFGGTVGGAIVQNKLFFFADYQGQRFDHPPAAGRSTVVPMAERSGDFSGLCTAGFNASNICTNPAQTIYNPTTHLPFTHNTIPTNMINSVASKLFASNFYPSPNSGLSGLISTTSSQLNNDQGDLKIDYYLSQKDKMFARWSQMGLRNPAGQSWALAVPNPTADEPVKNFVLNWDHNVNPNVLNEARVGFNYVKFSQTFSDYGLGNFAEQIGIANGNVNGPGFPLINFTSVSNIGNAYVLQNFGDSVIQAQDQVIITRNRHLLHAGFGVKRFRVNSAYAGNSGINGQFFFNGQYTATSVPDPAHPGQYIQAGGSDIADFLLGMPNQMQRGGAVGWGQRSTGLSAFLQDDWRVTEALTINAGLRYENHTPWVEVNDRQVNFGLFTGDIQFAGKDGNSRALYDAYNFGTDFQPRLGFAWSPKALGGKSVFRGAYSLSNYSEGMGSNNRLPQNVPFVPGEVNNQWGCTTTAGVYSCAMGKTIDQGIPLVPSTPIGSVTPASYAGLQIRMWDPKWRPAVTQQYNLSFQQQLTPTATLQASYVGQHSSHLTNFMWANQMILQPDGTTLIGPYAAGSWANKPVPTDPAALAAYKQTLKGQIGAIRGTFSNGAAKYNAMQLMLQQRTAKGLQAQFSYTLSRCMTDAPGFYGSSWAASQTSVGMPSAQNIYDLAGDWGNCYFDAKHLVTGYFVYELPFGRNRAYGTNLNPFANAILGNWELGGILTLRSGMHLEVDSWGDPTATGAFATRPNINGSMKYPKQMIPFGGNNIPGIQWFDPTVLSMPSGQFGNLAVGSIIGPPLKTLDLSLHKSFPFSEGKRVEFRAEAINFTNTPILLFGSGATFMDGVPDTNTTGRTTGKITQASGERNVQLALKFYF